MLVAAWIGVLVLPFIGKPVHVDDANFLVLAEGARTDLWRPHDILINWQGTTERAFDVLSNPPGVAWFLAPVLELPLFAQRLWMLVWLVPAVWGAWRLGRRFGPKPGTEEDDLRVSVGGALAAVLLLCTSPVFALSAVAFTPDLPLLALVWLGVSGFIDATDRGDKRAAACWAVLAGCSVWFRYSGLCVPFLLSLYALLHRRSVVPSLFAWLPAVGLMLHDVSAYGQVHFLAMSAFQSTAHSGLELFHRSAALLSMLGGAVLIPVVCASRPRLALGGLGVGVVIGFAAAATFELPMLPVVLFCAAGGAVFSGFISVPRGPRDQRFLLCWGLGGFVFLLSLRFAATRYWLPFAPAFALAWLATRPSPKLLVSAIGLQSVLTFMLMIDDAQFAEAQERLALAGMEAAAALAPESEAVFVAGHWGFQHYAQKAGAVALEDDGVPALGTVVLRSWTAWPQQPADEVCQDVLWTDRQLDGWWGPRSHSVLSHANYHASYTVGDRPGLAPSRTVAPWAFGSDLRDRADLSRVVACKSQHDSSDSDI